MKLLASTCITFTFFKDIIVMPILGCNLIWIFHLLHSNNSTLIAIGVMLIYFQILFFLYLILRLVEIYELTNKLNLSLVKDSIDALSKRERITKKSATISVLRLCENPPSFYEPILRGIISDYFRNGSVLTIRQQLMIEELELDSTWYDDNWEELNVDLFQPNKKRFTIGDTSCIYNANSEHLQCTVAPSDDCSKCKLYCRKNTAKNEQY